MYKDDVDEILFTADQIRKRVGEIGKQITEDYAGKQLVLVGFLRGAAWFLADLSRVIDLPIRTDFMVVASYGDDIVTSGSVFVHMDVRENLENKDVLLVDDIIDTGTTFAAVAELFKSKGASSVKSCAMCDKAERRVNDFQCDYVGFRVPDNFLIGYGMDYAGEYRNLPFIGILKKSVYSKN